MSPRRGKPSLRRKVGTREARPRLLIACEGTVTECQYIEGLKRYLQSQLVELRDCRTLGIGCDPLNVVKAAIDERNKEARKADARGDANLRFDEVWCLVDVDEHTTLLPALETAKRNGIKVVVSNPSFELWLLYHFQDYLSAVSRDHLAKNKLPKRIPGYDKHLPDDFPFAAHEAARQRAQRACPEHTEANRNGPNPSTNVWLVVDAVSDTGKRGREVKRARG
ncbi:RloB family protein [Allonocardiopsis opalescens]|uniref:RloB-like protein n=1 Tax=Allonocardiopsis opalescens TaxID=1144618 RepID=A0A2T0QA78_9ACTN|nr:RloB family protein [Allonocardiopsis opalescens]PRY00816.1 RloB-like protein [Allonocardiopsis opalescens]